MKIVGVMLARREDWVIGWSARAALEWCDALFVMMHDCKDLTWPILRSIQERVGRDRLLAIHRGAGVFWEEMEARELTLKAARELGGTHVAIIDADEIPTANVLPNLRGWFEQLAPRQCLDLPMVAPWRGLDVYRDDDSVWSRAVITLGFRDDPELAWHKAIDGYDHHHRAPYGEEMPRFKALVDKSQGGIMHLQFANWRRLTAKHALYKISETLRWPERMPAAELDRKYSQALDETGLRTTPIPAEWLEKYRRDGWDRLLDLKGTPWQEEEARTLFKMRGPEPFAGLNLWGVA